MIRDPERYRFVADTLHGVATVAIACTTCSKDAERDGVVRIFDFLYPSIGDVLEVVTAHEDAAHGNDVLVLRLAAELVTEGARHGSPSMLCRRLRQDHGLAMSFEGAQALLERLEAAGVVGPADGSKARAVLLDRDAALAALDGGK